MLPMSNFPNFILLDIFFKYFLCDRFLNKKGHFELFLHALNFSILSLPVTSDDLMGFDGMRLELFTYNLKLTYNQSSLARR